MTGNKLKCVFCDEWLLSIRLHSLLWMEYTRKGGRPSEEALDEIIERAKEGRTI